MTANCPHIVTSPSGWSYCDLAAFPKPISVAAADHLAAVEAERDALRVENGRLRDVMDCHGAEVDELQARLAVLTEAAERVVDFDFCYDDDDVQRAVADLRNALDSDSTVANRGPEDSH